MSETMNYEGVESLPLSEFAEKAYLDYSMYVILDRALPHVGDGFKPVQRRIVYAMGELGLSAASKHKKAARTVGDVIGKYHPHGDSACYEAMVLMAQPFSYRYPLIDGQGNWGSPDDPKSFAAMRYTEAKLTPYAKVMLSEIEQGTVTWQPNFDGTMTEPQVLPARLPNVFLNGGTGIAVGMSTDIPPHNLREIGSATMRLLDDPDATTEELMEYVQGPDFPTNAEIITPKTELVKLYETGYGSIKARAPYFVEDGEIVIEALPYQTSGAKVLEQIAAQMQTKKLPLVADLRDESDHETPVRLVVVPRSNRVDVDSLMMHLFATTDLEKNYRANFNMVGLDGKPQVKGLKQTLTEWLEFRIETVRARLQWRLDKVETRLHKLEGLLVAYLNIDEVIAIIREEDEPKSVLMERFGITDVQAEAILELKLRHLAKLEEMKIREEQAALEKEQKKLHGILKSPAKMRALIKKEIKDDVDTFGDERRSLIVERGMAKALDESDLMTAEPITSVISKLGWVRAAKGHDINPASLNYKPGDEYLAHTRGRSNQMLNIFDNTGRVYSTPAHTLPSARSQGEPLTGKLNPKAGVSFVKLAMGKNEQKVLLSSNKGYGFITTIQELYGKNKAGKAALSLPDGAEMFTPVVYDDADDWDIAVVSSRGFLLVFPANELPVLSKGRGNKLMGVPGSKLKSGEEEIVAITIMQRGQDLLVRSGKRHVTVKASDIDSTYLGERAKRGVLLPRGFQKVDKLEVS